MAGARVLPSSGHALPPAAQDRLLEWFAAARRPLPFRETSDPYAVLVSEAMAQQTQAARAGDAWARFMEAFPTLAALAAATPADVLRAWRGLGYNRRALNLRRAAQRIVEVHGGVVPRDLRVLEALPGIGPYTARAVAAIAFGVPVGAVDTNVRRVLGRMHATDDRATIQRIANRSVPVGQPAAWTHALMDLGATVCRPRRPDCDGCPVGRWCRFPTGGGAPQERRGRRMAPDRPAPPFPLTSRWLRGRIIDRLRRAAADGWTLIEAPIGDHDQASVAAALHALARDGLAEVQPPIAGSGAWRARLPIS